MYYNRKKLKTGSSPVARIKTPDSRRFLLIIFGNNEIVHHGVCSVQGSEKGDDW